MPHRLAVLILLLVTSGLTHAQHQHMPSADDEETRKLIISLESKAWELAQKRDVKDMAALFSEDYRDVGEFGIWNKQKSLQSVADRGFELFKFSLDHFRFTRLAPTVALLTYEAKQIGSSDGKPLPSPLFISSVWVNRKGKWLNILYQDTPAAATTKANAEELENQIVALEKRLSDATADEIMNLESADFEAIKHLHRYHREDEMSAAKETKMQSWEMDDVRVRMLRPDVGLISYHVRLHGTFRDIELPDSIYLSSIWVQQNGSWKNVFLAETGRDMITDSYIPSSASMNVTSTAQYGLSDADRNAFAAQSSTTLAEAEHYIRDSESQWAEAVAKGDVSVVQRILADDFAGVDAADGHLYPKAEAISWIQTHHPEFIFNHLDEVKVRFFGNTAVAQGSESWERRAGEPRRGRFVWTDTWVLRNGQWQIVAAEDLIVPSLPSKSANTN